jgi:hypothetical protein
MCRASGCCSVRSTDRLIDILLAAGLTWAAAIRASLAHPPDRTRRNGMARRSPPRGGHVSRTGSPAPCPQGTAIDAMLMLSIECRHGLPTCCGSLKRFASSMRPARLCRASAAPTWLGRAPLHADISDDLSAGPEVARVVNHALLKNNAYSKSVPYLARAGCATAARGRRMRLAPSGRMPALSWS